MFPSSEVTIMQYNSFLITSNISRNCLYTWMKRQPENLLNRHWYFVILEWCILGMLSGNLGLLLVINKLPAWFNHYSNRFFSIKAVFLLVRTQLFTHVIKFLAIGGLLMLAGSTSDTFHVKTQLFPSLETSPASNQRWDQKPHQNTNQLQHARRGEKKSNISWMSECFIKSPRAKI